MSISTIVARIFTAPPQGTSDPNERVFYGNLASAVGIGCNVVLFLAKCIIGVAFGSIAIAADALNNLSDASSNVVSLIGFKLGAKKADAEHPFGHARYEYLSGLCVCVMILVIGVSLLKESFLKVLAPTPVAFHLLTVGVLLGSIAVKLWLSWFNQRIGKAIRSDVLLATAADSRNDVIATGAVLLSSILCEVTGIDVIDGIMGLLVATFILISGFGLLKETLSPLLGESPDPELIAYIEQKALAAPGVLGVHDLIVHDYGPGRQFASLHLEFSASSDVLEVHDLIDNIEHDLLREKHILTTIHYDPIVTENEEVSAVRAQLKQAAQAINPAFLLHDLRLVVGPTHTNVIFDLAVPAGWHGDEAEIKAQLCAAACAINAQYRCVIEIETSYTGR